MASYSREEVVSRCPWMASPADLARYDTSGSARKFYLPRHLEFLNERLLDVAWGHLRRLICNLPFQHGKLLADSTKVLTTKGWKQHGELKVGDEVFSPTGLPVRVQAVSGPDVAEWEVVTGDGHAIVCHGKHEWLVYDRRALRWRLLETAEIAKRPLRESYGSGKRYLFQLPRPLPLYVEGPGGENYYELIDVRRIDPYCLGAWLGDGQSDRGVLSHHADDLGVVRAVGRVYPVASSWVQRDTGVCYADFKGLKEALAAEGALNDKHLHEKWLLASERSRELLLAGLIDTDGNLSKGQYRFSNVNRQLIDQTAALARTLGFKVGKLQKYEACVSSSGIAGKQTVYVIAFQATRALPCQLPRKVPGKLAEACRPVIAEIRKAENTEEGRCIQVEGGLYLAGENLTATHNSWLTSTYYPAWRLLWAPEHRIVLTSYEEKFSGKFGQKVKDVINRWGPQLGAEFGQAMAVGLRRDTKSKNEWVIRGHEGGMVCKGRHGAVVGRSADELIMDDMVKNAEEAVSELVSEQVWDFWQTVAEGRLGPDAPVVSVGTRWSRRDWFGRALAEARETGEKWEVVRFPAICTEKEVSPETGLDCIGRKVGEALWEGRRPLAQLERIRAKRGKWWLACWQQDPEAEEGKYFHPFEWPVWSELGGSYCVTEKTKARRYYVPEQMLKIVTVDWAFGVKTTSDYTAIGAFALTPAGELLILDVVRRRLGPHELAPEVANVCRKWRPSAVGVEEGHPTFKLELRRHAEIPEVRWLRPGGKEKLQRAVAAINKGYAGKLVLPEKDEKWKGPLLSELADFSGVDDENDDQVDMLAWAATMADWYAPLVVKTVDALDEYGPLLTASGREEFWR